MSTLSAVLITLNEAADLPGCLDRLAFCDEIVVMDSGSVDGTVQIAEARGARVFYRKFTHFSEQRNAAIAQATSEWILVVDPDETVTEALEREIRRVTAGDGANGADGADGYWLNRVNRILGRVMSVGGWPKDRTMRLFKKGRGVYANAVHETLEFNGRAGEIASPLVHNTCRTAGEYMRRLNLYTDLELAKEARHPKSDGLRKNFFLRFLHEYLLRCKFLFGVEGFTFSVLSGYYAFVTRMKRLERQRLSGDGNKAQA